MENVTKFIIIGVSVLLTVLLVGTGVYYATRGTSLDQAAAKQLSEEEKNILELEYTRLDMTEVNGATVISKIKEYENEAGDLIIQVTLASGVTTQYVTTGTVNASTYEVSGTLTAKSSYRSDLMNANDSTSATFINKVGMFDSYIARDSNDIIRALVFRQQ